MPDDALSLACFIEERAARHPEYLFAVNLGARAPSPFHGWFTDRRGSLDYLPTPRP